MTKPKKIQTQVLSEQLSLLDMLPTEGCLDITLGFKDCLARTLSRQKISRYQISARVSELVNRTVSKEMLDNYCSPSKDHKFPVDYLPAVAFVCDTLDLHHVITDPIGATVLGPKEAELARIARLEAKKEELDRQILEAKRRLGPV